MSEDTLTETMLDYQRKSILKHLAERPNLDLGQITKLINHPTLGKAVASLTLQEMLEAAAPSSQELETGELETGELETGELETETEPEVTVSRRKKKAAKKPAKKATKKKVAKKKAAKKASTKRGEKADKGRPKPRLDYDLGCKEVVAALKAAKEPVGRRVIEDATGYTAPQVRSFLKKLADEGRVSVSGSGTRSTRYALA